MQQINISCENCKDSLPPKKVPIKRIIEKLDECFSCNDLTSAEKLLDYWQQEAEILDDKSGTLTILNEKIGLYRRMNKKEKGIEANEKALLLIGEKTTVWYATIFVNIATTFKAFGEITKALENYDKAEKIFTLQNKCMTYEYAAFLNNKGSALADIMNLKGAEECYLSAIKILKNLKTNIGEIAVSYINLAHIYEKNNNNEAVDNSLQTAWQYLTSNRLIHDGNYAFICSKCAPSYEYFGYNLEAEVLREISDEIYNRN